MLQTHRVSDSSVYLRGAWKSSDHSARVRRPLGPPDRARVRVRRRAAVASGVTRRASLVLALLPLAASACRPTQHVAAAPMPAPAHARPEAPAPPPVRSEAEPEPEATRVAGDPAEGEARSIAAAQPYVVDPLGPAAATVTMRLSFAAARELPFADELARLFLALPDARLFAAEDIAPARDFDDVVFASHDLLEARNGVVVVRHRLGRAQLQASLERAAAAIGDTIEWSDDGKDIRGNPRPLDAATPDADPRRLVLRDDGTAIYALDELLAPTRGKPKPATIAAFFSAAIARPKPARPGSSPAVQLQLTELGAAITSSRPFVVPARVELTVGSRNRSDVAIQTTFASPDDARSFEDFWANGLPKVIDGSPFVKFTVRPIYDAFLLTRRGVRVQLRAQLEPDVVAVFLNTTASRMARPPTRQPAPPAPGASTPPGP